jgi:hypothetical protein
MRNSLTLSLLAAVLVTGTLAYGLVQEPANTAAPAVQPQSVGEAIPDPVPPVTVAEAESTRPGVPPGSIPPSQTLGWMLTFGVISNYIMRKMKESPWFPMVKDGAEKANLAVAGLLSFLSSVGIHTEFDASAGSLLFTGLTLGSIIHFGGDWVQQWALQQLAYKSMKKDY